MNSKTKPRPAFNHRPLLITNFPNKNIAALVFHDSDRQSFLADSGFITKKITNFTGSSCVFAIGEKTRLFASDARYEIQMDIEVDSSWKKMLDNNNLPTALLDALKDMNLERLYIVGDFCSYGVFSNIKKRMEGILEVDIVSVENFIAWLNIGDYKQNDQSPKIIKIPTGATRSPEEKAEIILDAGKDTFGGADLVYFGNKDFISWLMSERSAEGFNRNVNYDLLIEPHKDGKMRKIQSRNDLESLSNAVDGKSVVFDPKSVNSISAKIITERSKEALPRDFEEIYRISNIKDSTECANIEAAHKEDGAAMCKFLYWLSEAIKNGVLITEKSCSDELYRFRAQGKNFLGLSFPTISGFGQNGAIIHYSNPSDEVTIQPNGLYLVDSGGHYNFGTTDITRTIAIGHPSQEQKQMFTLVLKAHIDLATSVFARSTECRVLDAVCRAKLAKCGADYAHGTGHGIGYASNVHEGPIGISRTSRSKLEEGMILSNEPGFYKRNEYGIRIENVLKVTLITNPNCDFNNTAKSQKDGYLESYRKMIRAYSENPSDQKEEGLLGFETISLAPIDLTLIEQDMLSAAEVDWLNFYHKKTFDNLSEHLSANCQAWLARATRPI